MAADDDYKCDLCGTVKKQRDMTLVAPDLFKKAVRAGLRPSGGPKMVLSGGFVPTDWVAGALMDDTGWGLCQGCTSRVQGYLKKGRKWWVRGPRSE